MPVVGSREIDDEPVIGSFRAGHIKDHMSELSANNIVHGRNLRSTFVESGPISAVPEYGGNDFRETRGTRNTRFRNREKIHRILSRCGNFHMQSRWPNHSEIFGRVFIG